jgi:hypothetical protein
LKGFVVDGAMTTLEIMGKKLEEIETEHQRFIDSLLDTLERKKGGYEFSVKKWF